MGGDDDAFEALTDCVACLVESAVVEVIAPGATGGVVLESRCRVCLRTERAATEVHPGDRLIGDPAHARTALARWAAEEGDPDLARFVLAHFGGLDVDGVTAKLARGERVETSFDAIAWLFPGVGAVGGGAAGSGAAGSGAGGGGGADRADTLVDPVDGDDARPTTEYRRPVAFPEAAMRRTSLVPPTIPRTNDAIPPHKNPIRVAARALASVMLSDGIATPADRAFVDRTLAAWSHPPLRDDDLAVWRPHELSFPDDPIRTVEAMARLAYVDGQRDATEWRVVREFSRAWGVSLDRLERFGDRLDREHQQGIRRLVSRVTSLFLR